MTAATTVFTGGRILTMATDVPEAEAIACRNGRITAVGSREEIADVAGPNPTYVDLEGGTLLPGFQDAHVHPLDGGVGLQLCDLTAVHALDDYLRTIQRWADAHPEREWVQGGGWYRDAFPGHSPDRRDLDRLLPDRPAYLNGHDGHTAWVNSAALMRAGIDRNTPDPADGVIVRDEAGEPTGVLVEGAAALVSRLLPSPSSADLRAGMLEAQRYLHSLGVTAWQDAIVGDYLGVPDPYEIYRGLEAEGLLTARVRGALWWEADRGLDQLPRMLERREATKNRRFHAGSVKIMQDGVCENRTGAMLAPYLEPAGHPGCNTGMSFIDVEELGRITTELDRHGFQVHFHGVGDRAVRECLDAVQAARSANGPSSRRHQIAHLDIVDPGDIARFAELDVVANLQPLWARRDQEIESSKIPLLGEDRERNHFPFGSLVRAGARLAMGSDWPVTSPDPLWALHTAVYRTAPLDDPHADKRAREIPLELAQRISARQALHAYTAGAAYANHLDDVTGQIVPGRYADLVTVDADLIDPEAFDKARVTRTFIDGEEVYARPA